MTVSCIIVVYSICEVSWANVECGLNHSFITVVEVLVLFDNITFFWLALTSGLPRGCGQYVDPSLLTLLYLVRVGIRLSYLW